MGAPLPLLLLPLPLRDKVVSGCRRPLKTPERKEWPLSPALLLSLSITRLSRQRISQPDAITSDSIITVTKAPVSENDGIIIHC